MFEGFTTPTIVLFFSVLAGIVFFISKVYVTEIYLPEKINCALRNSEKIYRARSICPEKTQHTAMCKSKAYKYVCEQLPEEKKE